MARLLLDLPTSAGIRAHFDATPNGPSVTCTTLNFASTTTSATAAIALARFEVPLVLLEDRNGDWGFKPAVDLQQACQLPDVSAGALERDRATADAAAVRDARRTLREKLRAVEITFGVGATFFGMRTFAGGSLTGTASFTPAALLDVEEMPGGTLLELHVRATGAVQVGPVAATWTGNLRVVLDATTTLACIPEIRIPSMPSMPGFDFEWPRINSFAEKLQFGGLSGAELLRFLKFEIPPLFAGHDDVPLRLDWTTKPELNFTLNGDDLKVDSGTTAAAGTIVWTTKDVGGADVKVPVANLTGIKFAFANGASMLTGTVKGTGGDSKTLPKIDLGGSNDLSPVTLTGESPEATLQVQGTFNLDGSALPPGETHLEVSFTLRLPRLRIEAKSDRRAFLVVAATHKTLVDSTGHARGELTELRVLEPYPIELVGAAAKAVAEGVVRLLALIPIPPLPGTPDMPAIADPRPLLKRLGEMLVAIAAWCAQQAGAAGRALLDLAAAIVELLGKVVEMLGKAVGQLVQHVAVEVRLDARTWRPRQLAIRRIGVQPIAADALGLRLEVPEDWHPELVVNLDGPPVAAFVCTPATGKLNLATDLWLARDSGAPQALRDTDETTGVPSPERLIRFEASAPAANAVPVVLFALQDGHAVFFRKARAGNTVADTVALPGGGSVTVVSVEGPLAIEDLRVGPPGAGNDLDLEVKFAPDAAHRLLPFLSSPKETLPTNGGNGFIDTLNQYVKLKGNPTVTLANGAATVSMEVDIFLAGRTATVKLDATIVLATLHAKLDTPDQFVIKGAKKAPAEMFGFDAQIVPVDEKLAPNAEFPQFELDLRGGDFRLALHKDARLELSYRRVASQGRGIVFKVSKFSVGRGGIDLEAVADPDVPVHLAGADVPFRFTGGGVTIQRGRLVSFQISGGGQLPPKIVGEANVQVAIAFGMRDDKLTLQSASAVLDKGDDPIECKTTRFTLSLAKVELNGRDFGADGIHFWFALTGKARFTPKPGEFDSGMLKFLNELEITFDKAPLAGDPRVLLRHLEFHIAVRMKRSINFFNIFRFELRGFGFHSSVQRFGGASALSISGQVDLSGGKDTVSDSIEFHKLWIAEPEPGDALPRIALDGMGFQTSLGGAGVLEGTAAAIDGSLPSLDKASELPPEITPKGFLASGRLRLKGWAPMAASAGFMELKRRDDGSLRHAFFAFAQQEDLSIEIPTPIGTLYLREMGFGFGFRYTFASLVAADRVRSPEQLVAVLDEISKRQGDLANFAAWAPEDQGDRLTLAMRALFTVASVSKSGELNEKKEKPLPNPVLFDVAAALRSDLTFIMTARAWLCVNYWTWSRAEKAVRDDLRGRPGLRGYLYISAPKQMILGRIVADRNGYIGDTPKLPKELVRAIRGTDWSATMYIRPGLFHFEFGWPYELGFEMQEDGGRFGIKCNGGLVFRIEDGAALYGVAFRAVGFAKFGGSAGGRSFGASASARADFSIGAKLISYLSLQNPNDTFFYGSVDFAVTIDVAVYIWLEIDAGIDKFTLDLELSFSFSLTVGLELAVGPAVLAGRGIATVAVCGFGRTLGLGIAFGFEEGKLAEVRAKVERFMALGLESVVPDPAKGLEPPQVAPPGAANKAAEDAVQKKEDLQQVLDPAQSPVIKGDPIGEPAFWALLFPLAVDESRFVMTFIPRDWTESGIVGQVQPPAGTFYAPPGFPIGGPPLRMDYVLTGPAIGLMQLYPDGSFAPADGNVVANHDGCVANNAGKKLLLWQYLASCFLCSDPAGAETMELEQPPIHLIESRDSPLEGPGAAERLREASARQFVGDATAKASKQVEERRSSLVTAVGESAARLAAAALQNANGDLVWPARAATGIDARDLGLTFVVTEQELKTLFPAAFVDATKPAKGAFQIFTNVSRSDATPKQGPGSNESPVHLLNPPQRFFDRALPAFAAPPGKDAPCAKRVHDRVHLDWDLEPAWGVSTGAYHDPEFLLRFYRIERVVLDGDSMLPGALPRQFFVKTASPLELDASGGRLAMRRLRPIAQLVDALEDLSAALPHVRAAFLQTTGPLGLDAHACWAKATDSGKQRLSLLYTIIPIDIAGRAGRPGVIAMDMAEPERPYSRVAKAEVLVRYARLPTVKLPAEPTVFLRIDDIACRDAQAVAGQPAQRLPPDGTRYRVKVRPEHATPGGLFGSDAVTQAHRRPTPADFEREATGDLVFDVEMVNRDQVLPEEGAYGFVHWTEAERFQPLPLRADGDKQALPLIGQAAFRVLDKAALQSLKNMIAADSKQVVAVRVAVQRAPAAGESTAVWRAPWTVADTTLLVMPQTKDGDPVETAVECLEHPRGVDFDALAFEDLEAESGQVQVIVPPADADLRHLLGLDKLDWPLWRLADRAARTGTRITWNSQPVSDLPAPSGFSAPSVYPRLIGGFHVFEADLTGLRDHHVLASVATPAARVQLLPRKDRALEPASIEDYGKIEANFPSDSLRARPRIALGKKPTPEAALERAPWFSPAETFLRWPHWGLRRFVCASPDESPLMALFARGFPSSIVVELRVQARGNAAPDGSWLRVETSRSDVFSSVPHGVRRAFTWIAPFTPEAVSTLLRSLVWYPQQGSHAEVDEAFRNAPAQFDVIEIVLSACDAGLTPLRGDDRQPIQVTLAGDLAPPVHPFLADVLDALRWEGGNRRYDIVADPAPPTKAQSYVALMNEHPEARDPQGWAVLRTLGLAAGFKLFNLQTAEFVPAADALRRIENVVAAVRKEYEGKGICLGAPFVDVMMRPAALHPLCSFDATPPSRLNRIDTDTLLANEALALVQISLRPMPECFDADEALAEGVATYVELGFDDSFGEEVTIDATQIYGEALYCGRLAAVDGLKMELPPDVAAGKAIAGTHKLRIVGGRGAGQLADIVQVGVGPTGEVLLTLQPPGGSWQEAPDLQSLVAIGGPDAFPWPVVLEVVDVASGLAGGKPALLRRAGGAAGDEALANGATGARAVTLTRDRGRDKPTALVRVVVAGPAGTLRRAVALLPGTPGRIHVRDLPRAASAHDSCEPFERFDALSGASLATQVTAANSTAYKLYKAMQWIIDRRFPKPALAVGLPGASLLEQLTRFHARFSARGAAKPPRIDRVPFSLATLVRPDPWREAPTRDGRLSVLLLHKSRFATRKRFVIVPYGRYDNIAEALRPPGKAEPLSLRPLALALARTDDSFDLRSVDVTLPRSEPVRPPVFLSASRLDWIESGSGRRREGRVLEVVLARHPEEIVSEANRQVADLLQFDHVGVSYWREFSAPGWARLLLGSQANRLAQVLGAEFGTGDRPAPMKLSHSAVSFDEDTAVRLPAGSPAMDAVDVLTDRVPDGWRGIQALRTADVPYFFRVHALAYAAAGVSVSDATVATIAEGRAAPRRPWDATQPRTATPKWSVEFDRTTERVSVMVWLPLMSLRDGTPDEQKSLWFANGAVPEVFDFADHATFYEVALEAKAGAGSRSVAVELMPMPAGVDLAAGRAACYTLKGGAAELAPDDRHASVATVNRALYLEPRHLVVSNRSQWHVDVPLRKPAPPPPPPPSPSPAPADAYVYRPALDAPALEGFEMDGPGWATWESYAPWADGATITLIPPPPALGALKPDWPKLYAEAQAAINKYQATSATAAASVIAQLNVALAVDDTNWPDPQNPPSRTLQVPRWMAGLAGFAGQWVNVVPPANAAWRFENGHSVAHDARSRRNLMAAFEAHASGNTAKKVAAAAANSLLLKMLGEISKTLDRPVDGYSPFELVVDGTLGNRVPIPVAGDAFEPQADSTLTLTGRDGATLDAVAELMALIEASTTRESHRALASIGVLETAGDRAMFRAPMSLKAKMQAIVANHPGRLADKWEPATAVVVRRPATNAEVKYVLDAVMLPLPAAPGAIDFEEQLKGGLILQVLGRRSLTVHIHRGFAESLGSEIERSWA